MLQYFDLKSFSGR